MNSVTKISNVAETAEATNFVMNVVAVACGLALVVFAIMATAANGLDTSAGFF